MNKTVLVLILLFIACGILCARMISWTPRPDFIPDEDAIVAVEVINDFLAAVKKHDEKTLKKLWHFENMKNAKQVISDVSGGDGEFQLQCAVYTGKKRDRILVTGLLPNGRFPDIEMEKNGESFRIVELRF